MSAQTFFKRRPLPHGIPSWVEDGALYFITINCQPRKTNQLADDANAKAIFEAFAHYEKSGCWHIRFALLMPDHLHALISFNTRGETMSGIIQNFKRYLAKSRGLRWQRNYFDHRIRNQDALAEKSNYIAHNPVRAGLVKSPDEWPFIYPR